MSEFCFFVAKITFLDKEYMGVWCMSFKLIFGNMKNKQKILEARKNQAETNEVSQMIRITETTQKAW